MDDVEKKLRLMQKQIDVLTAAVITQAKNINTIIEILELLEKNLFPGIKLPERIVFTDLTRYKQ